MKKTVILICVIALTLGFSLVPQEDDFVEKRQETRATNNVQCNAVTHTCASGKLRRHKSLKN